MKQQPYDNFDRRYLSKGRQLTQTEEPMQPPSHEEVDRESDSSNLMGLYIAGTVIDRTRRMVPKDNPVTEIITYTLETDDHLRDYFDDYAPTGYHEREEYIIVPVLLKNLTRRRIKTCPTRFVF